MSRTKPNRREAEELTFRCTYCDRAPGEWCVTKSGAFVRYLHSPRWWAWLEARTEESTAP